MTANELKRMEILENIRANKAREENEAFKSGETHRSNVVTERETNRANLAKERETSRHNVETEKIGRETNVTNYAIAQVNRKAKREAATISAIGGVIGKTADFKIGLA